MNKIIQGICLEDKNEIIKKETDEIINRWQMAGNVYACIYTRGITIASSINQLSDNKITEFIINDKIIALIYEYRNEFNTIDLYIFEY